MHPPAGLRVSNTEQFGECLFAERAFAAGDIVLKEKPLIHWHFSDFDDIQGYFTAYLEADEEVQHEIDQFYCPPIDQEEISSPLQQRRKQLAESLHTSGQYQNVLNIEKMYKLLLIADANAHVYCGHNQSSNDAASTAALFKFGAKVSHSCLPNLYYTSKVTGELMYIATKPIAPDQMLSFSYIKCFELSRQQRLEQLHDEKYFHCLCSRCTSEYRDSDGVYCAYVSADDSDCDGIIYETSVTGAWKCRNCNRQFSADTDEYLPEILKEVSNIQHLVELWRGSSVVRNVDICELWELQESIQEYLPQSHALLIQLLLYIASVCRTYYHSLIGSGVTVTTPKQMYQDLIHTNMTLVELKCREIESVMRALEGIELIITSDSTSSPCAAVDYSNLVLWLCIDIIDLLQNQELNDSIHLAFLTQSIFTLDTRYYHGLVLTYGVDDADVRRIRHYLDKTHA